MHFGFPYCHARRHPRPGVRRRAALHRVRRRRRRSSAPHVAALGMRFYTGTMFPAEYRGQRLHRRARLVEPPQPARLPASCVVAVEGGKARLLRAVRRGLARRRADEAWGRPADVEDARRRLAAGQRRPEGRALPRHVLGRQAPGEVGVPVSDDLEAGNTALAAGRWTEARDAFEASIARRDGGRLLRAGGALWWLGENQASVDAAPAPTRCSAGRRRTARSSVRSGWPSPTRRTSPTSPRPTAGSAAPNVCWRRSSPDRCTAGCGSPAPTGCPTSTRAERAHRARPRAVARACRRRRPRAGGAVAARAASGSAMGETRAGFALIDEAMAAALAGERSTLDTVVYTCCDMLNACELATDLERAAQWCQVADELRRAPTAARSCTPSAAPSTAVCSSPRVAGRTPSGSLAAGLRSPTARARACTARRLTRLAALRIRQGRLEEADQLLADLGEGVDAEAEAALTVAALLLASGDAPAAGRASSSACIGSSEHRSHLRRGARPARRRASGCRRRSTAARLPPTAWPRSRRRRTTSGSRPWPPARQGRMAFAARRPRRGRRPTSRWRSRPGRRLRAPLRAGPRPFELARALAQHRPDEAIDHARRALGRVRGARCRHRRRPGRGLLALPRESPPVPDAKGSGCSPTGSRRCCDSSRRAVEPRDRDACT